MPFNVDLKRLKQVLDKMYVTLKQEKCIDVVVHFLDDLAKACGFTKATMYSLDSLMKETFKRGLTREKVKYCNSVPFKDAMTA